MAVLHFFPLNSSLYILFSMPNCQVIKLSGYQIVRLPNCQNTKLSGYHIVGYQIFWLPNCQVTKLLVTKLLVTKLLSYQIVKLPNYQLPNCYLPKCWLPNYQLPKIRPSKTVTPSLPVSFYEFCNSLLTNAHSELTVKIRNAFLVQFSGFALSLPSVQPFTYQYFIRRESFIN